MGEKQPPASSDDSIGRPADWREGRYQKPGQPLDASVNDPRQAPAEPADTVGTQTPPRPLAEPVQHEQAAQERAAKERAAQERVTTDPTRRRAVTFEDYTGKPLPPRD